ncbi:MAG: signal recognition particle-docking protein FtsY [Ignavibacteriales bacterium]|nr:MAG: signal recognition particle-docking protein FtsY [Ignavibacteriales bacterium]
MGFFGNFSLSKLKDGLSKTRDKIVNSITETVTGKAVLDNTTLESLEEKLIQSDFGAETSERIITSVRGKIVQSKTRTSEELISAIKEVCIEILSETGADTSYDLLDLSSRPKIILVMGVNGAGKTTTIGKLANNLKKEGLKVVVGAADTFRAAANNQLEVWAQRAGVKIIQKEKSDPSSVVFETVDFALKEKYDVVLLDTAGRLHTKSELMEELKKIDRVIKKLVPSAPHEVFLVLDGNSGQNTLVQMEEFNKAIKVTGLIITKLDGTAKGGALLQISSKYKIPVRFIGVGEGIDDLQNFDPQSYVSAIFGN